ncbi:hypothetical protein CFP56_028735 [Quercus suber]|uniref:Uncharacterized protein n=1 Tax=Quercus suber TaxID=58331 RepID=A0AAW0LXG0_QUESU
MGTWTGTSPTTAPIGSAEPTRSRPTLATGTCQWTRSAETAETLLVTRTNSTTTHRTEMWWTRVSTATPLAPLAVPASSRSPTQSMQVGFSRETKLSCIRIQIHHFGGLLRGSLLPPARHSAHIHCMHAEPDDGQPYSHHMIVPRCSHVVENGTVKIYCRFRLGELANVLRVSTSDHCCVEPLGILREGSELLQLLSQANDKIASSVKSQQPYRSIFFRVAEGLNK